MGPSCADGRLCIAVVRPRRGTALAPVGLRPATRDHGRHVQQAQGLGGEHAAMAGNLLARLVHQHRHGPAPFADGGSDLRHLILVVGPRIAGLGQQRRQGAPLDRIGRPEPLHPGSPLMGGKNPCVSPPADGSPKVPEIRSPLPIAGVSRRARRSARGRTRRVESWSRTIRARR